MWTWYKIQSFLYHVVIFIYNKVTLSYLPLLILRNITNQPLRRFPSETGISNRLAIDAFADLLAAFLDITFYHNTLDHTVNITVQLSAVHDFLDDTNLLFVLFIRVIVVGIDDTCRIHKIIFLI